jgi:hypothetical protein
MLLALAAIPALLLLTLVVPLAFRRLWPGGVARPRLFLLVTLLLGFVVAGVAIIWFSQIFVGIGISGASARTEAINARSEALVRNRFFTASVCAVLAQYWLCRGTQFFLGRP